MYAAPGIGLAAPQVGEPVRDHRARRARRGARGPGSDLLKLVNPVIAEREGLITFEEGCLSVVDFTAEVKRAERVLVKALTPEEKEFAIEADGLLAVALQHEIDHLDGKLFIDRISRLKRDLYKRKIKKVIREGRLEEEAAKSPVLHI